jgi:TPR repeat protein
MVIGLLSSCNREPSEDALKLYEEGFDYYSKEQYDKALPLLQRASELGSGDADCELGVMYELGSGVAVNLPEAFRYYERAANRGSSGGQFRLGRCYQEGIGIAVDKRKALHWHRKAAEQDNRLAPYSIDTLEAEGIK